MDWMTRLSLFIHPMLNPKDTRVKEMLNIQMAFYPIELPYLTICHFASSSDFIYITLSASGENRKIRKTPS